MQISKASVSVQHLPFYLKLCCFLFSLLWLQRRWGFPQASIIQRGYYATFLWWSRKDQGWDYCSPGNWKSECLIFLSLGFSHIQYDTRTHMLTALLVHTLCKAGSACHPLRIFFIFCLAVRALLAYFPYPAVFFFSSMACCQPHLLLWTTENHHNALF